MANKSSDVSKGRSARADMKIAATPRQARPGLAQGRSSEVRKTTNEGESVTMVRSKAGAIKRIASHGMIEAARPRAHIDSSHGKTYVMRFGSVTIKGRAPAAATVKHNIALGQAALKRGLMAFVKPGVKLPRSKGIPKYRADPNDPSILIRELNGRDERGTLAAGEFKIAK
jgi:hypothetical protein